MQFIKREHVLTIGCLGVALALAGCGSPAASWHQGGVAADRRDADFADCRAEAHAETQAGIDQDMAASQAGRSPFAGAVAEPTDGVTQSDARRTDAAFADCMTAKGYHSP